METKICKHCSNEFDITDKDLEFYEKVSPVFSSPSPSDIPLNGGGTKGGVLSLGNGKIKYLIPPPTLCPNCRQQRRLSFRNERKLYKRKCDFSGRDIISIYSPDKNYKVYDQEIWWSDKWDALYYGREFDFSKVFFEQFQDLNIKVAVPNLLSKSNENSYYVNHSAFNKNCYLCFNTGYSEDCLYLSNYCLYNKDCIDCLGIQNSQQCYNCIDVQKAYKCKFLYQCSDINNSYFCYDCIDCENCINCYNLRNKKYCIDNIQLKKEDFYKIVSEKNFNNNSFKDFFEKSIKNIIYKSIMISLSENASGNYIKESKNIKNSYNLMRSFDCSYSYDGFGMNYSMDFSEPFEGEFHYETHACNSSNFISFTNNSYENNFLYYCYYCFNSSHLFGCIGLRNKSYCILNKQYTKEEYETLVPQIIEHMMKTGEWGEFFPSSLSPFGYNETVAQEYFPLESSELSVISQETDTFKVCKLKTGNGKLKINWSDYEAPFPKVEKIIPASKLPENISEIPDDILNWAIECEITKKPFRIIKQELEFYRKYNLPIPRRHPDQRHLDRMSLRNPRHLYTRNCDKCGKEIQTTYAPERPEIVYCQDCYEKEVY